MRSRPWTADLARMGQLVVAVALAGRSHGTAFLDRRGDLPLPLEDDRHQLRHLGGSVAGDHDHARAVRPEQVAGSDPDAADPDLDLGPQHADPVLPRAHEHPAGDAQHVERIGDHGDRGAGENPWSGRGRGRAHAAAGLVSITDTLRPPWKTFTFSARLALAPKPAKRPARIKVSQLTRMAPAETPSPWPSGLPLRPGERAGSPWRWA